MISGPEPETDYDSWTTTRNSPESRDSNSFTEDNTNENQPTSGETNPREDNTNENQASSSSSNQ